MSQKYLDAQLKKIKKIINRAQVENSNMKGELLKEQAKYEKGTSHYDRLNNEINKIRTISDGTKKTYYDTAAAILHDAYEKFYITHWKDLRPENTQELLLDRIATGQSANTIRKVAHALDFINEHATKTRVFKEKDNFNVTNHKLMLEIIEEFNIVRHYKDSHRYKANPAECLLVLEEMGKRNPYLASIARYQYLTGFRVSEAIRQKEEYIDLIHDKHEAIKAKGGLDNIVYTNHHNKEEKAFLADLKTNFDKETGRVFKRQKNAQGNYKSDEEIRRAITRLARRSADKLGISGTNGETFSSHSFRGGFAYNRMIYYCSNYEKLDSLIKEKISEQDERLEGKYEEFKRRIKEKCSNPCERKIQDYEKIQWLISTDLNHSRQDVTRFYVSVQAIKKNLLKFKNKL
ncbi:hypothetical protein [Fictibacillus sp. 26RED30]|uniref:hypothetical protein n=1 Tax=Fictibacillus sp. 26RED30 TaxID=2745877 RepID=UPI0018CE5D47|nr:hypothetical protein [Fictibacillus sp. 26RED30]MBH0159637.1 hypothetical protein [Fictibacillus sp. 26RED30]